VGADELFSDYGFGGIKKTQHSNFGGLFPQNLNDIFPWPSFYYSSMESYIAKEEYVAGLHGIEARYPFLDRDVVQEFLWLSPELKNSQYKSVIDQYFINNQFPFSRGEKKGF
jgi:asparagine synthetase B (glutamine-hydrolysing)